MSTVHQVVGSLPQGFGSCIKEANNLCSNKHSVPHLADSWSLLFRLTYATPLSSLFAVSVILQKALPGIEDEALVGNEDVETASPRIRIARYSKRRVNLLSLKAIQPPDQVCCSVPAQPIGFGGNINRGSMSRDWGHWSGFEPS